MPPRTRGSGSQPAGRRSPRCRRAPAAPCGRRSTAAGRSRSAADRGRCPAALAGVQAQGHARGPAQGGDLPHRGQAAGDVAGGGQHHQVRAPRPGPPAGPPGRAGRRRRRAPRRRRTPRVASRWRRGRMTALCSREPRATRPPAGSRPRSARLRASVAFRVKTRRAGSRIAQQVGAGLPGLELDPAALPGQAVAGPAGVAAHLRQAPGHGLGHAGGLGEAGGGIVQVDHRAPSMRIASRTPPAMARALSETVKQCSRRQRGSTSATFMPARRLEAGPDQPPQHAVDGRGHRPGAVRAVEGQHRLPGPDPVADGLQVLHRARPPGRAAPAPGPRPAIRPGDAGVRFGPAPQQHPAQVVAPVGLHHRVGVHPRLEARAQGHHHLGHAQAGAQVALGEDGVHQGQGPQVRQHGGLRDPPAGAPARPARSGPGPPSGPRANPPAPPRSPPPRTGRRTWPRTG